MHIYEYRTHFGFRVVNDDKNCKDTSAHRFSDSLFNGLNSFQEETTAIRYNQQ